MNDREIKKIQKENKRLQEENKELKKELNILKSKIKSIENIESTEEDFSKIDRDEKDDMSIISFLARSDKRVEILKSLNKGDKIPSIIGKDIGDSSHHVSKYLANLKEKELVMCLNESDKRFRFYSITPKGKHYLDIIENKKY